MDHTKIREGAVRLSAAVLLVSSLLAAAEAPQRKVLSGHLPAAVPSLQPRGRLDGSTRLDLAINLPLRDSQGLTNLIEELYDPASPLFHHYLAPEEFDARFGPTEADYQALIDWATGAGFTVTARHPNRLLLDVNASVADIESALRVTMRTYTHPTESRTFHAPDTEPSVAADVPILYIGGLDNSARPHPKNLRRTVLGASARPTPKDE